MFDILNKTKIRLLVIAAAALLGFLMFRYGIFQPAALLLSPNSGETFSSGQKIEFRWTAGSPGVRLIELAPASGAAPITIYQAAPFGYPVADTSGSYLFDPLVATWLNISDGLYYVRMYPANSYNYEQSVTPIRIGAASQTISPPPTVPTPAVTASPAAPVVVISPNGGETYTLGSSIRISWSGGKNKVWVGIAKGDYRQGTTDNILGWVTKNGEPNSSVLWDGNLCVLPDHCWLVTDAQPGGSVRAVIVSENDNGDICTWSDRPCNLDASDAPFTVLSPSLTPPPATSPAPLPSPSPTPLPPPASVVLPKTISPVKPPTNVVTGTPTIVIRSPNGGERFNQGQAMKIAWTAKNAPARMRVSIYLFSKEAGNDYVWAANVAYQTANSGVKTWVIPKNLKSNGNYYIRVSCDYPVGMKNPGCASDDSDKGFGIGAEAESSNETITPAPIPVPAPASPAVERPVPQAPLPREEKGFFRSIWDSFLSIF